MTTDLEMMIEEEFATASINGRAEVVKFYTDIRIKLDKQLEFFLSDASYEEETKNIECFENCENCNCLESGVRLENGTCTKFNINVSTKYDGCSFYEN